MYTHTHVYTHIYSRYPLCHLGKMFQRVAKPVKRSCRAAGRETHKKLQTGKDSNKEDEKTPRGHSGTLFSVQHFWFPVSQKADCETEKRVIMRDTGWFRSKGRPDSLGVAEAVD